MNYEGRIFAMEIKPNRCALISIEIEVDEDEVQEYKEKHGGLSPEFKESLQVWYNKNKGENTIEDLLELLSLK